MAAKRLAPLRPLVAPLDMRTAKPAPKTADPFYLSPAWRQLVAHLVRARGRRCEAKGRYGNRCADDGTGKVRLIGDHIHERKDGGAELDPANIELMCLACHNAKTARERARRLRG